MRALGAVLVLAGMAVAGSASDPVVQWARGLGGMATATVGWILAMASLRSPSPPGPPARGSRSAARGIALVVAVSAAARLLVLLPDVPPSDDLYRYLWDGRVGAAGVNPFRFAPQDEELAPLRDETVWARVNHPDVPTIYPPVAQFLLRGLHTAGGTPRAPRAAAIVFDVASVVLLAALLRRRGAAPDAALLFGWCPLAIVESGAGGHVDSLGVMLLLAAIVALERKGARAALAGGALLGLSTFVKPVAPFAGPALLFARPVREQPLLLLGAAATLLVWLPYAEAGSRLFTGLSTYARHWHFNDAIYSVAVQWGGEAIVVRRTLAILSVIAAFLLGAILRGRPLVAAPAAIATALLLSPTVHPWYVVWLAPFLPFVGPAGRAGAVALLTTMPLAYVAAFSERAGGGWAEPAWLPWATWGTAALALGIGAVLLAAGRARASR